MKNSQKMRMLVLALGGVALLGACDVDKTRDGQMPSVDVDVDGGQLPEYEVVKTQEGKMPEVDVSADSGRLPEYDIDTVDIDLGTKQVKVDVPDVDVKMKEKSITVPDIDLEFPDKD